MHQILGGYPHSIYCGFGQGKALKLKLKKGSKSARILMPILHSEEKKDKEGKTVKDLLGDPVTVTWTSFKTACVFNIDQFEDSEQKQKILDKFVSAPDAQVQSFKDHKPTEKLINSYIKRESIDVFFGGNSNVNSTLLRKMKAENLSSNHSKLMHYTPRTFCLLRTSKWGEG